MVGYILIVTEIEQAKAKDDLGQMISCLLNQVRQSKRLQLHEAYLFVCIGCISGHNVTVDSFHSLNGNEQLDNFLSLISLTNLEDIDVY